MSENFASQYAPARRSDSNTIKRQKELLEEHYGSLYQLYDAISELILIVNHHRQIVFFNSAVPSVLGFDSPEKIYGLRLGEALGCAYSCKNPGGCGTSEYCSQCGAVNAILSALNNKADLRECRVLKSDNVEALDLLIRTTPLKIKDQLFSIIAITDISDEKRRLALERIFFHDVMNTTASINLFASLLNSHADIIRNTKYWQKLLAGLNQLMDELSSQKELLAAESGELVANLQSVDGYLILKDLVEALGNRFPEHEIVLNKPNAKVVLNTDSGLLQRVLENMILNALEASEPEEAVRISCMVKDGYAEFRVHNKSYIPKKVQLQLFQRSFSTKGIGRGLGTYSMKLISKRYLNGDVSFNSSPNNGTIFVARYPV